MPRWEALKGANRALATYLLQNTRFLQVRSFKNKWMPKLHHKSMKIAGSGGRPRARTFLFQEVFGSARLFVFLGSVKSWRNIWANPIFRDNMQRRVISPLARMRGAIVKVEAKDLSCFGGFEIVSLKTQCKIWGAAESVSAHSAGPTD